MRGMMVTTNSATHSTLLRHVGLEVGWTSSRSSVDDSVGRMQVAEAAASGKP